MEMLYFEEFVNEANESLAGLQLKIAELNKRLSTTKDKNERKKIIKQIMKLNAKGIIGNNKSKDRTNTRFASKLLGGDKFAKGIGDIFGKSMADSVVGATSVRTSQPKKSPNYSKYGIGLGAAGLVAGLTLGGIELVQNRRKKRLEKYQEEYRIERNPRIKAELKEKINKLKEKINGTD